MVRVPCFVFPAVEVVCLYPMFLSLSSVPGRGRGSVCSLFLCLVFQAGQWSVPWRRDGSQSKPPRGLYSL